MRAFPLIFLAFVACHKPSQTEGIHIQADQKGFHPATFTLEKDKPAKLIFTRTTDDTCAKEVVFKETKLEKPLPLNTPVEVDIPPGAARTLNFQCGMGMFSGKITIE